jgi:hypothetical protein
LKDEREITATKFFFQLLILLFMINTTINGQSINKKFRDVENSTAGLHKLARRNIELTASQSISQVIEVTAAQLRSLGH